MQVIIIIIATILFLISALSGLGKGVKILSNTNLILAIVLLAGVIVLGPTVKIFDTMTDSIGLYFQNFFRMSFRAAAFDETKRAWINQWTIFYWAWWITWSPFTGVFIARISKGRTIREFIMGVILVPSIACMVWFGVFGNLALNVVNLFDEQTLIDMVATPETALYFIFNEYPAGTILSIIAVIV